MSETLHDSERRKALLKHMILELHQGQAPDAVRPQLQRLLGSVPYDEVVEVEQELIAEGLPTEEILKLCDIHTQALQGLLDEGGDFKLPPGHPVDVLMQENQALRFEVLQLNNLFKQLEELGVDDDPTEILHDIRVRFAALMDVEKHYQRKENLLFPFLEKKEITGPPTVMWGKHDEARALLKGALQALGSTDGATSDEAGALAELVFRPATEAIQGMVEKEEQILLPMCLDVLEERDWIVIARGTAELGYCLVVPEVHWDPGLPDDEDTSEEVATEKINGIRLPSGAFTAKQLEAVLNSIPFDVTFVDADDIVRYFSEGRERIFSRTRAILGREVQYCHPPKSVDMVQKILADFHEGREDQARFWLELGGKFIIIEYFALRDDAGQYLGCLEVSQDLTEKRTLTGSQRLLNYVGGKNP